MRWHLSDESTQFKVIIFVIKLFVCFIGNTYLYQKETRKEIGREEVSRIDRLFPGYSLNLGVMCALVARPITTSLSERSWLSLLQARICKIRYNNIKYHIAMKVMSLKSVAYPKTRYPKRYNSIL